jgi:hypothetical protein
VGASGSSGDTASNPTTSNLWPSSTTYITISPSGSNFELGKTNRYYFEVRATGASGTVYSSQSTEDVKIVSPKAPTITYTVASSTSVNLTITPASYEDWYATGRYIVYTYDITGGTITSGGGRGAVTAGSNPSTVTLTGLTPGRNYTIYALPVTGTSGTTPSNYSGYPGIEGYLSGVTTGSADPQAFTTISYVKNFPSSSSGGVVRTTSLSWNASTNATRYEIEYEGSYNNSTWTTVQSFAASPYTSSTSQSVSWGSPVPAGGFDYYTYMRARVRASNPDSSVNVIGDGGSYIYAAGVAPGQPTFGTITYNTAGTTASIPVTVGTAGSNYLYSAPIEYQYRASSGSYSGTWTSSSTPISLTSLTPSTTYYIKIRTRNYDELVSPENDTSFATPAASIAPTGGSASIAGSTPVGSVLTLTKTDATGSPTPTATWLWRINDGGFGGGTFSGGTVVQNGGTTYTSQYSGYSVRVEITWSNAVAPAQSVITNTIGVTAAGVAPSGGGVTLTPSGTQMAGTTISANVTAMSGTATISYETTIRKKTGSAPTSKTDGTEVASGTGTGNGVATHTITTSEASGTPDQFKAFTTGTNTTGSNVVSSNTITSTPYVATQYTVTWNANGGTGGTTTTFDAGTAHSAPAATRSGYTLSNWRNPQTGGDPTFVSAGGTYTPTANITFWAQWTAVVVSAPSGGTATSTPSTGTAGTTTYVGSTSGWSGSPTSYSYSWQYFSQNSFTWVAYSSGTNFSPPSGINTTYQNYGWQLSVGATNSGGTTYATTSITVNNPAVVSAPSTPTGVTLSSSGLVSWSAVSGADSYEVQTYTDQTGSPANTNNRLGPYTATGITGTSYQLSATDNYSYPNNYARIQVRARNTGGVSTYSAWVPSSTTYT